MRRSGTVPTELSPDEAGGQQHENADGQKRQHEPEQQEHHHHRQHDPEEPLHQAVVRWARASTLSARNETPERSSMFQVVATSSVTLTGVNSPMPLSSPATLTVITSRVPPPTTKRWTWLMPSPLSSTFCALVPKSIAGSGGPAETKFTALVSTGSRMLLPSKGEGEFLP